MKHTIFSSILKNILSISILSISFITGQSIKDIDKLRSQYEKEIRNRTNSDAVDIDENSIMSDMPSKAFVVPGEKSLNDLEDIKSKFFGYDFFSLRDTVSFWENLPIPNGYLIGPGDELIVSLWGETQFRKTFKISRDGKIYDEKVGLLNLNGKNIDDVKTYLKTQFGRVYSTINSKNPSTYIDVSIGELKSINVNFVGQVKFPGIYPIHPFSNVIMGLIQAGGVDTVGSLRNIRIIRSDSSEHFIDLYDYFIDGNLSAKAQLRDQDIIIVPPRLSHVIVDSAVNRPGIYESIPNETVYDILQNAGGVAHNGSNQIIIQSLINIGGDTRPIFDLQSQYVTIDETKLIKSNNIKKIVSRYIFDEVKQIEVIGQVKAPGFYNFIEGMTLKDIISLSSGFEDETFFNSVYQGQAEVVRRNPDSPFQTVITFDISDIFDQEKDFNIILANLDRIIIHPNLNFFETENIKIEGEVKVPGHYPVISDEESLFSIVQRAGGLTKKAFKEGIEIHRDTLRLAWKDTDVQLKPGDSIVVKEKPGTVFVTGEVYNPGLIEYKKFRDIADYVNLAGGPTKFGDRSDIIVVYANGEVMPKKFLRSPKVRDGSTIVVNSKKLSEPLSVTEIVNTSLSLISSIVTILVLAQQAGS